MRVSLCIEIVLGKMRWELPTFLVIIYRVIIFIASACSDTPALLRQRFSRQHIILHEVKAMNYRGNLWFENKREKIVELRYVTE